MFLMQYVLTAELSLSSFVNFLHWQSILGWIYGISSFTYFSLQNLEGLWAETFTYFPVTLTFQFLTNFLSHRGSYNSYNNGFFAFNHGLYNEVLKTDSF